jgi:hypothetical protein
MAFFNHQQFESQSKENTKARVIRRQIRRETRNTYIFFIMLFGHSCLLPHSNKVERGRNQSRREEAVIFLHCLSCLFQNLSYIPRETIHKHSRTKTPGSCKKF